MLMHWNCPNNKSPENGESSVENGHHLVRPGESHNGYVHQIWTFSDTWFVANPREKHHQAGRYIFTEFRRWFLKAPEILLMYVCVQIKKPYCFHCVHSNFNPSQLFKTKISDFVKYHKTSNTKTLSWGFFLRICRSNDKNAITIIMD